jgi:polysaccharide biosynthesis PFTS motif protein
MLNMHKIILFIRNWLNFSTEPPEVSSLSRVRSVLRGYRIMRSEGKHNLMKSLRYQLTETKVNESINLPFAKFIMPYDDKTEELSFRQYLLLKLIGTRLNGSVLSYLYNGEKLSFPLPYEWIKVLEKNGIKVSRLNSLVLFNIFAIKQFTLSFVNFFKLNFKNLLSQFQKNNNCKDFIYFFGLQPECIPPLNGNFQYNIIEWYLRWDGREKNINQIKHSLNVDDIDYRGIEIKSESYLPRLNNVFGFLYFFFWSLISLILSFIFLIFGFPKFAILLSEIQKAKLFELANNSEIGKDYLNNNGNMIYRPIWTYAAEKRGAKVTLYNWSAGFPDILGSHGYPPPEIGQTTQNWPFVIQWSPLYTEFLKSIIKDKKTQLINVPPIYFSDIEPIIFKSSKPIIAVFDVTPQKTFFHDILIPSVEYRTYLVGKQFLEDIYSLAQKHGFEIIWKRKRGFISNHSKAYIKFCEKFVKQDGIIEVDPRSSAFYLVQQCVATISMPFTSTALVAQSFQKPSIYYDPTMKLFKHDRGAQDLSFMIGKNELDNWMSNLKMSLKI